MLAVIINIIYYFLKAFDTVLSVVHVFSSCRRAWDSIRILPWVKDCKISLFSLSFMRLTRKLCDSCPCFTVEEGEHTWEVRRRVLSGTTHGGLKARPAGSKRMMSKHLCRAVYQSVPDWALETWAWGQPWSEAPSTWIQVQTPILAFPGSCLCSGCLTSVVFTLLYCDIEVAMPMSVATRGQWHNVYEG